MDKEIRDMNYAIMEAIDEYNQKIKIAQTNVNRGYEAGYNTQSQQRNFIENIEVQKHTPIYDIPNLTNSRTLWWVDSGNTTIVKQIDNSFYQVKSSDNKVGYVWVGWFK